MKIRLCSINGKLGDPAYNEEQMEKAVLDAVNKGIDLLFFPENSINSDSIGSLASNKRYCEAVDQAENKFKDFIKQFTIQVRWGWQDDFWEGNYHFDVYNGPFYQDLEYLQNAEEHYVNENQGNDSFLIVCQGRGTESTCERIYSNLKMIIYRGKLLASNRYTDEDVLDYDFNELYLGSNTPYLDEIKDTNRMFEDILNAQCIGLYNKMKSMNRYKITIGISGGLDSTISLLACVECFKRYNLPLENIIGVTMPGLGTTERTYKNALHLMMELGITILDIDLKPLLKMHLNNIKQPEGKFDVTFEQTQSRERTQVLLDLANKENAIMIGTGCMSEFALGWMSYGGDHLCMYAINIGLPKTVVKMYASWFIDLYEFRPYLEYKVDEIVRDILEGPVSPELLPIDENGEQHEKTESIIGDYRVQDYFIYHMTVNNVSITDLFYMTCHAFPQYSHENILKWLEIFTLRYFTRAYKKNCYGDGLALFSFSVSPKYYHVPSDIDNNIWQQEIEELKKSLKHENL